jgi:hypothetical protein
MVSGIRAAMNIARQPKLAEIRVSDSCVPNSESDSDIRGYMRKQAMTDRHPARHVWNGPGCRF